LPDAAWKTHVHIKESEDAMVQTSPKDMKRTGSFEEEMRAAGPNPALAGTAEPVVADGTDFKLALFHKGVLLGYLGENDSAWAVVVGFEKAVTFELYPYKDVNYFRKRNSSNYLSVSRNAYVGFYGWLNATGWTVQAPNLVSDYNGQKLSFYSKEDGYLYAWNDYTVLEVKLEYGAAEAAAS
jgi:hypothetical protein